jgi:hypothetical protein
MTSLVNSNQPVYDTDEESVIDSGYRQWIELREMEFQKREEKAIERFLRSRELAGRLL